MPLRLNPANDRRANSGRYLLSFGPLKSDVSVTQAQAEMRTIAQQLEQACPEFNTGWSVNLVSLHDQIVGGITSPLLILLGVVGLALLIACANMANLLLARHVKTARDCHQGVSGRRAPAYRPATVDEKCVAIDSGRRLRRADRHVGYRPFKIIQPV